MQVQQSGLRHPNGKSVAKKVQVALTGMGITVFGAPTQLPAFRCADRLVQLEEE